MKRLSLLFFINLIIICNPSNLYASCNDAKSREAILDSKLDIALGEYQRVSNQMYVSKNRTSLIEDTIRASTNITNLFAEIIEFMNENEKMGCVNKNDIGYQKIKQTILIRFDQFKKEKEILIENKENIKIDSNNMSTNGKNSEQFIEEQLGERLSILNKKIPLHIDEKTILVEIKKSGKIIIFTHKLDLDLDTFPKNILNSALEKSSHKKICGDFYWTQLFSIGYSLVHVFKDNNNVDILSVVNSKDECLKFMVSR